MRTTLVLDHELLREAKPRAVERRHRDCVRFEPAGLRWQHLSL